MKVKRKKQRERERLIESVRERERMGNGKRN